jgi:putative phosphoesterase
MRIAVVSDIHGNGTAFEAVLKDLEETSPDLILHGGDLADGGSSPVEIVERIRDLGWKGVAGNTDEMLFRPESLQEFASHAPQLNRLFAAIGEMAAVTRELLGEERIAWLRGLPRRLVQEPIALVHASPESLWRAPGPDASDEQLQSAYRSLGTPIAVYGHIHRPYIRKVAEMTVVNTGSAGLPYDGDRRAAYLLVDDSGPSIRRVEYDLDRELRALAASGLPHTEWVAKMLESASPRMP